jgi:thioredoxin 1
MSDTTPIHVSTVEAFDALLEKAGDKPVFVDFFAQWCGPCKMADPIIEKVAAEYDGKAIVAKVDTDELRDLAVRYNIASIPTILVFKKGMDTPLRQIGLMPKAGYTGLIDKALAA